MYDQVQIFGSVIQDNEEIDRDVTHHIQSGWFKWRAAIRVVYDKNFPSRLNGVAIRSTLLYNVTECWPI